MLQLKLTLARAGKIIMKLRTAYNSQLLRTISMLFQQHHPMNENFSLLPTKKLQLPATIRALRRLCLVTQFIHERNKPPCSPQLCTILKLLTIDTARELYMLESRHQEVAFVYKLNFTGCLVVACLLAPAAESYKSACLVGVRPLPSWFV